MRFVPVLMLLAQVVVVNSAAAQRAKTPRLDINGDPLPAGAVARLGTLRFQPRDSHDLVMRWGWTTVTVALSPDGTTVAAATNGPRGVRIDFLDSSTGKTVRTLDLKDVAAQRMQFTSDGNGLVLNGGYGIQMVDARTGKVARTIEVEHPPESAIALTSDGKWAAVQPRKYVKHVPVGVWDTKTGKEVVSLPGRGARCKRLAFGPDGKRLLLWSVVPTHVSKDSIGFDSDSKAVLACIDFQTRKIVGEATVNSDQAVALGPDGETVAIEAANHRSVRIHHLPTASDRCSIPVKASRFAFAPDGKVLLTIDDKGRAVLWDARKGSKVRDLEGTLANADFEITGISKDGKTIAALDGGWHSAARLVVWNAVTGKRVGRPPGHDGAVTCIAYASGGGLLASGSIDRTVRLWDPATGKHLRILTVHKDAVRAVAFSPDGKLVASSSHSGVTRVSSAADGKAVAEFAGPDKGAAALAFSPDGKVLFMGGDSPEVVARTIAGGKEAARVKTGSDGSVMAFTNDGALALTANGEIRAATPERLRVWDLTEKRSAASLPIRNEPDGGLRGSVHCSAAIFSPGGRLLASSQYSTYQGIRTSYGNNQLRLWERVSGETIRTLGPIVTQVLAFSPNGRLLAAGSAGESGHLSVGYGSGMDVWDALTGEKAGSLPVTPKCVAFSPDGAHLATGGRDHCVLIWQAPALKPRKKAKAPSAAECAAWWTALGRDAKDAYKAIGQMLDAPERAVALLKERVRPVQASDPVTVAKLIVQLESETFAEREKAQQSLEKMGEGAAHLLSKAIQGNVNLELHRRVERLLRKCNETSTRSIQHHRAVAALEWIGTPAARALLQTLGDGAPGARLTMEAGAAVKRLER